MIQHLQKKAGTARVQRRRTRARETGNAEVSRERHSGSEACAKTQVADSVCVWCERERRERDKKRGKRTKRQREVRAREGGCRSVGRMPTQLDVLLLGAGLPHRHHIVCVHLIHGDVSCDVEALRDGLDPVVQWSAQYRHSVSMASAWCQHGVSMVSAWRQHGVSMAPAWCQHGASMVSVWCQYGASTARHG